jgi:pimeloyl-ACP methyl ester carboxylesterase
MRFRKLVALAVLAGLMVVPGLGAAAQTSQVGTFRSADCPWEGLELGPIVVAPEDEGFECGYVTVPERHSEPNGPTIEIPVAIRRAQGAAPTPLFLAQGGPGGSAFEIFSLLTTGTQAADGRDIVIFNQRGTSFANPDLSCIESFDAAAELLEADEERAEELAFAAATECRERLDAEGVDLSAFNTVENAADIPLIAAALGYGQIDFYGVSYGTLLGLHLLRDHPEAVRSAILDAVVPTQLNFIPEVFASENRLWSEVFAHCSADPVCSADYPDLENRLFALVERLDEEPIVTEVVDSETGARAEAELTGTALLDVMFQLMYSAGNYAFAPKIIADLEDGDATAIEFVLPLIAFDRTFSEGMYYTVICAEDADFAPSDVNLDGVRPQFADGAIDEASAFLEYCELWEVEELDASVDDPVTSDVPTLLLSGRFDPITPPSNGDLAAATLTNSTHVVHPYGAHGVAFDDPCIDSVMAAFLADPDTAPDTSCVAGIQPEETVPADAVTLALVGEFGMLDSSFLIAAALTGLVVLFTYTTLPVAVGLGIRHLMRRNRTTAPTPLPPVAPGPFEDPLSAQPFSQPPAPPIGQPLPAPQPEPSKHSALIRWPMTLGVGAAYGLAATVLAVGLGLALVEVAFNSTAYLGAVALPPSTRWLLLIPWLLLALAVTLSVIAVRRWGVKEWSVWGKLYTTLLALAAVVGFVLAAGEGLLGF